MTQVILTVDAEADIAEILDYLTEVAGDRVVDEYQARFRSALKRLEAFPNSGSSRDEVDLGIRAVIVYPYVIFHEVASDGSLITVLPVLHGRMDAEEKL